jgi:hypothetical protein
MQAFHNDPAVKAKYVARLAAHRAAENLIQGTGFDGGKGCAVGCTLEKYDHDLYPIELGLPAWLAYLEDRIFEGLPKGEAEQFAEDFLSAIPVGADVSNVRGLLAVQRLTRLLPALDANPETYAHQCAAAVRGVIAWHEQGEPEGTRSAVESVAYSAARSAYLAATNSANSAVYSAYSAAYSAADSAARSAVESVAYSAARSAYLAATNSANSAVYSAYSAAYSAADSAARSAARSAADSARSAADSAARSARSAYSVNSAARSAHYRWEAETLLALLRVAPVVKKGGPQ